MESYRCHVNYTTKVSVTKLYNFPDPNNTFTKSISLKKTNRKTIKLTPTTFPIKKS